MRKLGLVFSMVLALGVAPAFAADVNFNTASAEEMMETLDMMIDMDVAKAIVAYREANGPFKSEDDLRKVPGMTSIMFSSIDPAMEGPDLYYFEEVAPAMHSY